MATELVLQRADFRPVDLGALAASGHSNESCQTPQWHSSNRNGAVTIGTALKTGDIIEFNSIVLGGQVNQWGGKADRYPITKDNYDAICKRVEEAQDHDLILINAGSSAGAEDFSVSVIEKLGKVLVHGVAVRPGILSY